MKGSMQLCDDILKASARSAILPPNAFNDHELQCQKTVLDRDVLNLSTRLGRQEVHLLAVLPHACRSVIRTAQREDDNTEL